jgi:hypothetical protein
MDDVRGLLEGYVELEDSLYRMNMSLMTKELNRQARNEAKSQTSWM